MENWKTTNEKPARPLTELEPELEEQVKARVLTYLEQGKPNWDMPHTLKVVEYMRELLTHEGGNARVLIPAAYFHDSGYSLTNVAGQEGIEWQKILDVKRQHAVLGSAEAAKVLREIGGFTEEEIIEIARLVLVHDDLGDMPAKDFEREGFNDLMIVEADSLGMIDPSIPGNLSATERKKFIEQEFIPERLPLFKSDFGKQKVAELLEVALARIERELGK